MESTESVVKKRKPATARDWREEMGRLRIRCGTRSLQDYMDAKRTLDAWLSNLAEFSIEAPSYEACVREIADWVGV